MLSSLFREFREELLPVTIRHAAERSAWYAEHFGSRWTKVRLIEDLENLPPTTKAMLRSASRDSVLTSREPPHIVQHTSGTTDAPFFVYRNRDEVEFVRRFLGARSGEGVARDVVTFHVNYHGDLFEVPVAGRCLNVSVLDEFDGRSLFDRLAAFSAQSPGRVLVTGIFHHLRHFTAWMQWLRRPLNLLNARGIVVTGQYVDHYWRSRIEDAWGCPLISRLSLTEGFGGAFHCHSCGEYHFDQYCIPEVLAVDGGAKVCSGVGVLHLTSLYPFVQMMPFIRYRTNDLVLVRPSSCPRGDGQGFVLLGRMDHAILVNRGPLRELLVAPLLVQDVLSGVSSVATDRELEKQGAAKIEAEAGIPLFDFVLSEGTQITVTVRVERRPDAVVPRGEGKRIASLIARSHLGISCPAEWCVDFVDGGTVVPVDGSRVPELLKDENS